MIFPPGAGVLATARKLAPVAPDGVVALGLEGDHEPSALAWAVRADDRRPVLRGFIDAV